MLSRVAQTLIALFMVAFLFACDGTLEAGYEETAQSASEESQEEAYESDDAVDPTTEESDEKADSLEPTPDEEPEPESEPETTELEEPAEPEETEPTRPEPGSVVEFAIQDGTGAAAWNSRDNPVEVYVGQYLVVYNEDSRPHRIHSPENGPIAHGRDIPPGGFASYEVVSALEVGTNPTLYDHNDGPGAAFWIRAIE